MGDIKKLEEVLISGAIAENEDFLINIIPEISSMIGFEHKHPHHHLDVWNHTILVVNNIESKDIKLKIAGLLHDIGKPFSYQDEEVRHFHGHPEVSAKISKDILSRLGFDEDFIKEVCYLISTHDTIIDPDNLDNTYEMIRKRLALQYADAKAHAPDKVEKRIQFLDDISNSLKTPEKEDEVAIYSID